MVRSQLEVDCIHAAAYEGPCCCEFYMPTVLKESVLPRDVELAGNDGDAPRVELRNFSAAHNVVHAQVKGLGGF